VNTVEKHAAVRPVSVVSMRIGGLRQVVPDTLDFYFDFVSKGTLCEGATLEYELIPARLRCTDCSREWETDMPYFMCPDCGAAGHVEVACGDEFEVESIEVEEAECIAQR
jgi:hydrogenase nickel incorporation protein HypA/HybF